MSSGSILDLLERQLTLAGWVAAAIPQQFWKPMTRPIGSELVLGCRVSTAAGGSAITQVLVGVGHPRSMRLMPRLTLSPEALLIVEPVRNAYPDEQGPGDLMSVDSQDKLDDLMLAIDRAVQHVAGEVPDAAALESALNADYEDNPTEPHPGLWCSWQTDRVDAAVELAHRMQAESDDSEEEFDRFVRQLDLWVTAGRMEPPELDAWPAEYFQGFVQQTPESARVRERREKPLRESAFKAARPHAQTDSLLELTERLERELDGRGLHETRATTAQWARLMQAGRWGRARPASRSSRRGSCRQSSPWTRCVPCSGPAIYRRSRRGIDLRGRCLRWRHPSLRR